jgi:Lrp/AsnC family transcriptional regulator
MKLDQIDLRILGLLQEDVTLPLARIADRVGLSQTPCWKRIQKQEELGVIRRRVAILDPGALGLGLTAFLLVEAAEQTAEWRAQFLDVVSQAEAICDIYRLAGNYNFLLRVEVEDMAAFDGLCDWLTGSVKLRSVNTLLALERMKVSSALPLSAVARRQAVPKGAAS